MRLHSMISSLRRLLLLLHFCCTHHLQGYTPEEHFIINCGSSSTGTTFDGERTRSGDSESEHLSTQDGTTVSAEANTQATSFNRVPYTNARLSLSQFNYSFSVTPGPKFIRLFFHPNDYHVSFPRNNALFSVHANQFTLLHHFNASLNADAQQTDTIFREYLVHVEEPQKLINLSFTAISQQPNSYAFINGIEVLSMPTDLYYTPANNFGFTFVGYDDQLFRVETTAALETVYRINVGGKEIWPGNDTGLFRKWAGDEEAYLTQRSPLNNDLPAITNGTMNITVKPDYASPKELYKSARNMGTNATFNKISNLTWQFPVDPGFVYMLRLHFCELDPNIIRDGDRKFFIYIESLVADARADVMTWTQNHKGVAVQKNFAVLIAMDNTQKKVNLSLQLHPYTTNDETKYSDAFLNGLEIFKIGYDNLAGPNPDPVQTPPHNNSVQERRRRSNRTMVIDVVVGVLSGVVLISVVVLFVAFWLHERAPKGKHKDYSKSKSSLPSELCRKFSLAEIEAATNNFDDVLIIGTGGFGDVYKGYIDEEGLTTAVAIKRLKADSRQGANEFANEIEMLSQLRHLHLVSLVGYCADNNEMILVYDFMARGTLRQHLYDNDDPPLSWIQRLHICIGAARGLHHLHTGAKHTIIHRDVKTTNILLDEKWVAKVSDFGLSRATSVDTSHVSTVVKGSFGYIDPEYYKRYRLTEKSDVYSFGVVLFEVLCGRPPLIHAAETQQVSLANWVRQNHRSGTMAKIVDPTLKGKIGSECFKRFCEVGISCLLEDGRERPSMNDVVGMLELALQLQQSAETLQTEEEITSDNNMFSSEGSSGVHCSSSKDSFNTCLSWNPFSEIMDPNPR